MPPANLVNSLLALGALVVLAGCAAKPTPVPQASTAPWRPVALRPVAFEPGTSARRFVGIIRGRYETDLGFRVAGQITARLVNVRHQVRAGDVVARLDAQDLRLSVQSAE